MSDDADNLTNESTDARVETALLQRVLDLHPTRMTAAELVRDLAGEDIERIIHMKTLYLGPDELMVGMKVAVTATDSAREVAGGFPIAGTTHEELAFALADAGVASHKDIDIAMQLGTGVPMVRGDVCAQ